MSYNQILPCLEAHSTPSAGPPWRQRRLRSFASRGYAAFMVLPLSSSGSDAKSTTEARQRILTASRQFFELARAPQPFVAGTTYIPVTTKVLDAEDLVHLIDASLDLWLTAGRYARELEAELPTRMGRKTNALLVNSGSSANLVAVSTLGSTMLKEFGWRPLEKGDEVITVAAGFPTTVNPIFQNGWVPVFVDVDFRTLNARPETVMAAKTPRTRAVVLAHALGNPYRADVLAKWCREESLYLVEDCCDALGASISVSPETVDFSPSRRRQGKAAPQGERKGSCDSESNDSQTVRAEALEARPSDLSAPVGSFGDFATLSFYPAHHITTGEGGAVIPHDGRFKRAAESIRDWGRDCWCEPGKDNTCGKRFQWQLGDLPCGYDHKYTYSNIGYNLKMTDMQAAVGLSQLNKLDGFIAARRANWQALDAGVKHSPVLRDTLIPVEPTPGTQPSWFGFPMHCNNGLDRERLVVFLEEHKVGTRLLFGSNLTRQPAYSNVEFRIHGELTASDEILRRTFWIGVHPALDGPRISYMLEQLEAGVRAQHA